MIKRVQIKQLAHTGLSEAFGVLAGAFSGLVIVNLLPKEYYGQYIFLITCLSLLVGLSDLGLGHCYLPIVGTRVHDTDWVKVVCGRVYRYRRKLLVLSVMAVLPYLIYTTHKHEWGSISYYVSFGIVVLLAAISLAEQYSRSAVVILGDVASANRISIGANLIRFILVCSAAMYVPAQSALIAIFGATLVAGIYTLLLYRATGIWTVGNTQSSESRNIDLKIRQITGPLVLPGLFHQFQGAAVILLIPIFGTADMMAEIGALTRLAIALVVIDRAALMLLLPAVARADDKHVSAKILRAHAMYILAMSIMLLSAIVLPSFWILLLGKSYESLVGLVWIAFLANVLFSAAGFAFATLNARGETRGQFWSIPFILAAQALFIYFQGIADTASYLGFAAVTGMSYAGYQYVLLGLVLHRSSLRINNL